MKYLTIILMVLLVSGCTIPDDHMAAADRYIAATCDGMVLGKIILHPTQGLNTNIRFHCAEEGGVKAYRFQLSDVPLKYWRMSGE